MAENNNYFSWSPEEQIIFTGKEFEVVFNSISGFINGLYTPQSILGINEVYKLLQAKLESMVQAGTAKSYTPQQAQEHLEPVINTEGGI